MRISTKGRYAIKLMLDLATNDNGEPIRLKDVARRQEISSDVLPVVFHFVIPAVIRGTVFEHVLSFGALQNVSITVVVTDISADSERISLTDIEVYSYVGK